MNDDQPKRQLLEKNAEIFVISHKTMGVYQWEPDTVLMRFSSPKMHQFQIFWGSVPDPAWGAYVALPDFLASGEGARFPLPKNPLLLALQALHSAYPHFIPWRCHGIHDTKTQNHSAYSHKHQSY